MDSSLRQPASRNLQSSAEMFPTRDQSHAQEPSTEQQKAGRFWRRRRIPNRHVFLRGIVVGTRGVSGLRGWLRAAAPNRVVWDPERYVVKLRKRVGRQICKRGR